MEKCFFYSWAIYPTHMLDEFNMLDMACFFILISAYILTNTYVCICFTNIANTVSDIHNCMILRKDIVSHAASILHYTFSGSVIGLGRMAPNQQCGILRVGIQQTQMEFQVNWISIHIGTKLLDIRLQFSSKSTYFDDIFISLSIWQRRCVIEHVLTLFERSSTNIIKINLNGRSFGVVK